MIYFHAYTIEADGRQTVAIAVVEDGGRAARVAAQGYAPCTPAAFRAAWQLRDACALAELRTAVGAATRRTSIDLADHEVGFGRARS